MTRIDITEGLEPDQGAFTGQWFEADNATHYSPPPNRGEPLVLWKTQGGAWVLTKGNILSLDGRRAVVLSPPRAAAILNAWRHPLPPELEGQESEL